MFLIFVPIILLLTIAFITFGVQQGKIPLGDCGCGGKYRFYIFDAKWNKNVYKCDKCKKTKM
jgi:hypothetical protein